MKENEGLDRLSSFYKALDEIPTPVTKPKQHPRWGVWGLATAPFAASLLGYLFMAYCASAAPDPNATLPIHTSMQQLAKYEMTLETPVTRPSHHAANHAKSEVPA